MKTLHSIDFASNNLAIFNKYYEICIKSLQKKDYKK